MDGLYNPPQITAHYDMSYLEACERLRMLDALPDEQLIAFDIECMSGETACVGFADTTDTGFCINFRSNGANLYTLEQERNLRLLIHDLFTTPGKRWVAQNGMFDSYWLGYRDRITVPRIYFDTMLAHHTLYPGLPHDLAFLTAQYTDQPYYKDEGKEWRSENDIPAFWEYNVKDCCITLTVAHALQRELNAQGLDDFFRSHVMRLQPHLVNMTVGGILCDTELKLSIADTLKQRLDIARRLCHSTAAGALGLQAPLEYNPRSPRDLQRLFFDQLRLVGRGTSTDKENRQRMRNHPRTSEACRSVIDAID
jgi:DNA polymerase I-like protein with 3'-5' exonuclease and polymerase domains